MSDNYNYGGQDNGNDNGQQPYEYGGPVEYGSQNQQSGGSNQSDYHYQDPYQNRPPEEPGGFAIASLVLGIVSIVLSCTYVNIVTGIISVILGAIHLVRYKTRRGMAITGVILSIVSIVILIALLAIGLAVLGNNPEIFDEILNEM